MFVASTTSSCRFTHRPERTSTTATRVYSAQGGIGDHWFDFPEGDREPVMREIADRVEAEALPWLERLQTPTDLAQLGPEIHGNDQNTNVIAEIAYSHILAGDQDAARAALFDVRRQLAPVPDPFEWQIELATAAELVESDLDTDPVSAVRRLRSWRDQALKALGLWQFAGERQGGRDQIG